MADFFVVIQGMVKRFLFVSSLLLAVPAWATGGAADELGARPQEAAVSAEAGGQSVRSKGADGLGKADTAKDGASGPTGPVQTREALLVERQQRQREVYLLRSKRESTLSRLVLNRLAESRGGGKEPFTEKRDKELTAEIQEADRDLSNQITAAEAKVAEIDRKLAGLDDKNEARDGAAGFGDAGRNETAGNKVGADKVGSASGK
ncbi:MAG: hypothetical protein Q4A16_00240 [Lautropia sp.]|nr:hypothetical protein [Lautropia sp.]